MPVVAVQLGLSRVEQAPHAEGEPNVAPMRDGRELALHSEPLRYLSGLSGIENAAAGVGVSVEKVPPDREDGKERRNNGDDQERADWLTQFADPLRVSTPQTRQFLPKIETGQPEAAVHSVRRIRLNAASFAVYAATSASFSKSGWPDLTKAPAFDRAPDTGSYAFPLAVSNADLVGLYKGTKTWSFQEQCSKKKCSTKAIVKGQGNYKLSRAGKVSYKGSSGGKISCNSASTRTSEKFSMNVKKSGWVKGKWRATKWVGILKVASAKDVPECGAGSYNASLTGTLKK
jgi:hypothetical protein